ncbi:hypothetical protein A3766_00405 [Oleiphilus sp. HI0132]|uniref:hypothetical protein n=1 Tax=Oleiphilus sp. HI0132 TaxID=1822270 RepID=UPI0007C35176|nr:hypothetical protein [Oleiphilus sp. HI0132]KZZ75106.1 hypothetical protein A3766_00405 [Oleiphilus sp. HI0132]
MTATYYVIKPTTHARKKVTLGDQLSLTESQARPLRNGGFITPDKAAADRISELVKENTELKASQPTETTEETKDSEVEKA